jgi:hypothetical protein
VDAPAYYASTEFESPRALPAPLALDNYSIAELRKIPAAWAVVTKHLPSLKFIVAAPTIQPHLGVFTVKTIGTFIPEVTPAVLAAIDAELRSLPPMVEPLP